MRINQEFIPQIDSILSDEDMYDIDDFIERHVTDYQDSYQTSKEKTFLSLCKKIKQSMLYDNDSYTLRRVVVGSPTEISNGYGKEYDLNNILRGKISSSYKRMQSWTLRKSSPFILRDRYETYASKNNSSVMIMMEKTFPIKNIITHVPSLIRILHDFGYDNLWDSFFATGGLYQEEEVLVDSPTEIQFEKLWFFQRNNKSFKKIPYKQTSGTLRIPLVEGGFTESNMIYF